MKKLLFTKCLMSASVALGMISAVGVMQASAKTVSVTKYGARPNDNKDDTAAIQAALRANPNGTVTIPKGKFICSVIWLYGNTTLKLSKKTTMKLKKFKTHPEDAWIVYHTKKGGYKGFKHIKISGGVWDGGVHGDSKTNQHKGIEVDHGTNLEISHMTFKNFAGIHMIETNACKNVNIHHVKFKNIYYFKGKLKSKVINHISPQYCEAIEFDQAIKSVAYAQPWDNTPCRNVKITNCTFDNVQAGIGHHHSEDAACVKHPHNNVTISNNTFKNIKGSCIHMMNIHNGKCFNNVMYKSQINYISSGGNTKNLQFGNNVIKDPADAESFAYEGNEYGLVKG